MKTNYALAGILVITVLCLGVIDSYAQNTQKKSNAGDPTFSYDSKRDMTIITYPDGKTMRVRGEWDEKDVKKLHDTMLKLEEQLGKLEDIEIDIPNINIELSDLNFQLHDLSDLINDEIHDALRFEDFNDLHIELDELNFDMHDLDFDIDDLDFDFSHLDDLDFDFDMSHIDDFDFDFSHLDEIINNVEIKLDGINDIRIRIPGKSFDIEHLQELNLRLSDFPRFDMLFENNLRLFDWDRRSVKERKNRKIIH